IPPAAPPAPPPALFSLLRRPSWPPPFFVLPIGWITCAFSQDIHNLYPVNCLSSSASGRRGHFRLFFAITFSTIWVKFGALMMSYKLSPSRDTGRCGRGGCREFFAELPELACLPPFESLCQLYRKEMRSSSVFRSWTIEDKLLRALIQRSTSLVVTDSCCANRCSFASRSEIFGIEE